MILAGNLSYHSDLVKALQHEVREAEKEQNKGRKTLRYCGCTGLSTAISLGVYFITVHKQRCLSQVHSYFYHRSCSVYLNDHGNSSFFVSFITDAQSG